MQSVKKTSVKDKLDGNEIDLSLLELTEVPVKELAAVPRGTVLDLSNNKLVILPSIFPTLTHLVKLDLSKNQLKELPVDFGNLRNLRQLDLYSNKLQRLPVSFHQLKELRFLDLKDNPLVPTLAEAAGDCVDHRGCQEAAKKVVKLMTVVYTELERKREKEQEEAKARQLAQKQEEDRAREKSRLEKKAEKDKRKEESQKRNQQTIPENKPIAKNKLPSEMKNGKKMQRKQDHSPPPMNRSGPSLFSRLFTVLSRLLILATVAFCVVFALNWSGPLTLDNATVVAHRSVNKIELFYKDSCRATEPHLRTVRQQWANFSRYVAENGRDLAIVTWDKTKHYAQVVKQQANVSWPVVQKRAAEVVNLTGDTLKHCWEVIAREAPIYYRSVVEKVTELYHKTVSGKTA